MAPDARRRAGLALALALCAGGRLQAATPGEVAVGELLRDAALDGLNGPARRLSDFRGRPLLINVWASWCGPCRAETASLERLAWSDAGTGLTIIGISTDDSRPAALAWLARSNATLSHYIDHRLELEHLLGATSLPLTVIVDAQGRVQRRFVGARAWDGAEAVADIRRALKAPARPASARPAAAGVA